METICLDDGVKVTRGLEFGPFSNVDALAEITSVQSTCESLARTLADATPEKLTRDSLSALSESLASSASALSAASRAISQDWHNMPISACMEKAKAMGVTLDEMANTYACHPISQPQHKA